MIAVKLVISVMTNALVVVFVDLGEVVGGIVIVVVACVVIVLVGV